MRSLLNKQVSCNISVNVFKVFENINFFDLPLKRFGSVFFLYGNRDFKNCKDRNVAFVRLTFLHTNLLYSLKRNMTQWIHNFKNNDQSYTTENVCLGKLLRFLFTIIHLHFIYLIIDQIIIKDTLVQINRIFKIIN